MTNGIDWFRWHHGSVTDPKFQLIASKASVRLGDVIAVWGFLLEKASANLVRGEYGAIDLETVDFMLGAGEGATARIMQAMNDRGLLEAGRIEAWERRQPKREREDSTAADRKRQQRAREAEESQVTPCDDDVTPCHTTSHQKTPRVEKSREEKKEGTKPKAKRDVEASGSRLPPDWHPSAEDTLFCKTERPDLRPSEVAKRFYDHWIAKPGKDGRKANWSATWRNWVRNEKQQPAARGSAGAPAGTVYDQSMAAAARAKEKIFGPAADEGVIDATE
jgi:hypothetical protein